MVKCNCFSSKTNDTPDTQPIVGSESEEINSPVADYGSTEERTAKKEKAKKKEEENPKKDWSKALEFKKLDIVEFDSIFTDFAAALNPFAVNREKLEKALELFKKAVGSYCAVRPRASFKEYVDALKTNLQEEGIFIKIKEGVVRLYAEGKHIVKAVQDAVAAIKQIIEAGKALLRMPEIVVSAGEKSLYDFENLDVGEVLGRNSEVSVFECGKVKVKRVLSGNAKKLKQAPKMVKDFCYQVKIILMEIRAAFSDEEDQDQEDEEGDERAGGKEEGKRGNRDEAEGHRKTAKGHRKTAKGEGGEGVSSWSSSDADDEASVTKEGEKEKEDEKSAKKKGKENQKDEKKEEKGAQKNEGKEKQKKETKAEEKDAKNKGKKDGKKDEKKEEFHKKLKIETVGIPDVDKLFTDLATAINRFVVTRETMQQAKESFVKVVKTITEFDGEKEVKAYLKELREKAKQGKITIYLDTRDGHVKVTSIKGVDPPAPYRDAVKALNSMKNAGQESLDLEPTVQRALQACIRDIQDIDPARDFKKMVSGFKAAMTLPKKLITFNDNRKKVQQAPAIIKEFCLYVKELIAGIVEALEDDEEEEKRDSSNREEARGDVKSAKDDGKKAVQAEVHASGSHGNKAMDEANGDVKSAKDDGKKTVQAEVHASGSHGNKAMDEEANGDLKSAKDDGKTVQAEVHAVGSHGNDAMNENASAVVC